MKTKVYLSMSADVLHPGHIRIINQAAKLGELTVGVLSDEAITSFKRYPILRYEQRAAIIESIKGVARVMCQQELDYTDTLNALKPDIVVHGDNWRTGVQAPIRAKVVEALASYGGRLVEFPYYSDNQIKQLDEHSRTILGMPENRRQRLRELLKLKKTIRVLEAHNGLTGLIVEKTCVEIDGKIQQFDGMWVSSLCDSTMKGKPDIELVDNTSRLRTIDEIMEVTTKPIILDGDTGGKTEHFAYLVKTLERMGVSAIIIEDKIGLKKNSLFGTDVEQTQDTIEGFCEKIRRGKEALTTEEFMVFARCESLILERGMEDALERCRAYVDAGADGIMIHSRRKNADEITQFIAEFRAADHLTPIVIVPTTFNETREEEWSDLGVNVIIYANHLIRASFPAMETTAKLILANGRCKEADELLCMGVEDVLTLIPE
ncbi:MAG: phosphoenolpyruvate mutase [Oscillospiraceae bacterium]|nr:phosphoenolpyruvate mutase [Oscillospiraceae bacterium]